MPIFELLKWVAWAGVAHVAFIVIGNNGGGDTFLVFFPIAQIVTAGIMCWLTRAGEIFQKSREQTSAGLLLVAVLPASFLLWPAAILLFILASVAALWFAPSPKEANDELPFWRQVGALTAALAAASVIPGMVGNRLDEDTTSVVAVVGVLAALMLASAALLLTRTDIGRMRSRYGARRLGAE